MVVPPKAGMPSSGSGTQAPAYPSWRMLAEVVRLHLGDEEASREGYVSEQQEATHAAHHQELKRRELEQIADSLRSELTMQEEQNLNYYVQEQQTYFTSHLTNAEIHLQAEVANTRLRLQRKYWVRTSVIEARAAASENAYAQLHRELLEEQSRLQEHQRKLLAGGYQLRGEYNEHVGQLRRVAGSSTPQAA